MTDYYPLLARAVAGLEKNTSEARRELYGRARTALLAQLRSVDPPLSETEINRERLTLEEAVRKVEAETVRQQRADAQRDSAGAAADRSSATRTSRPGESDAASDRESRADSRARTAGAQGASEGIPGLRDVVAEAEGLGDASAEATRSAREAYASVPSGDPELDRVEPRMETEGLRGKTARDQARSQRGRPAEPAAAATPEADTDTAEQARRRPPGPLPRRPLGYEEEDQGNPARRGLIAAILAVIVIAGLGGTAYWQRDRLANLFGAVRGVAPPRDQAQTRPKTADRVGQESNPEQGQQQTPGTPARPGTPPPLVAQRVVLYEEDPANPDGVRYVGSALWRTETVSPGRDMAPELAIRADVEVPERRLAMTMSIRRNTDQTLPASHTVEIMFNLPADFAFGGVANVPGLLMKEAEQMRGAPLSGLAVKVTNNFFLIGLSATEADLQRNLQLLKERAWFDIPIVYNNNRRAILAVEKGNPGDRAFTEAFAAWGKK